MKFLHWGMLVCLAAATGIAGLAQTGKPLFSVKGWTGSWAASQQLPEPNNLLSNADLDHAVLRQVVHLSVGGERLRLHLSNAFGTQPFSIEAVHVAHSLAPGSAATVAGSDREVHFHGVRQVTIPAGAEYISDAVDMKTSSLANLAVTIVTTTPPSGQTGHPGSRAVSFVGHGSDAGLTDMPGAKHIEHWYILEGVDVQTNAQATSRSVVALGDSITDGHGSTIDGNTRWPDELGRRLAATPKMRGWGVLNQGIGGNHLLTDGLGPNVLARFDRDVLAQTGVRAVIVVEGVNDLGGATREADIPAEAHRELVARILAAYEQMIERAHAHGLKIFGGTITPYVGSEYYHPGPASEHDRQEINAWILTPGHFDAGIDFSQALEDPEHPDRLLARYDSGDHLHPSPAGYMAMAGVIPIKLLLDAARP